MLKTVSTFDNSPVLKKLTTTSSGVTRFDIFFSLYFGLGLTNSKFSFYRPELKNGNLG
jgi:hypothetical protein